VAIRLALHAGAWDEARRHADALAKYLGEEQPARASLVIEGARLLAEAAANPDAFAARERLSALREVAAGAGLMPLARWLGGAGLTFTPV